MSEALRRTAGLTGACSAAHLQSKSGSVKLQVPRLRQSARGRVQLRFSCPSAPVSFMPSSARVDHAAQDGSFAECHVTAALLELLASESSTVRTLPCGARRSGRQCCIAMHPRDDSALCWLLWRSMRGFQCPTCIHATVYRWRYDNRRFMRESTVFQGNIAPSVVYFLLVSSLCSCPQRTQLCSFVFAQDVCASSPHNAP